MPGLLLRIRRANTPGYATIKKLIATLLRTHVPIPRIPKGLLRTLYTCHRGAYWLRRRLFILFYAEPLLRGRCEHVGERLFLWDLPVIMGHTFVYIGDDVTINGKIGISSGRTHDHPKLVIGNKVHIGKGVSFVVNQEITIEDEVQISPDCSIRDSDSHPLDYRYRSAGFAPLAQEIRPVRICKNAWIGADCTILKGVTIGEGAIIGTRSVVMSDIPPFARAVGNPARVILNPGPPKGDFAVPVPVNGIQTHLADSILTNKYKTA